MEYIVKHGDSLWSIAKECSGDGQRWTEIARLNHLSDPSHIIVGQRLSLPVFNNPQLLASQISRPRSGNSAPSADAQGVATIVPAQGFFFVLADEINPLARKLVRKVIVPDHGDPQLLKRLMNPEQYGFFARDSTSNVSLGRHVLGDTKSRFVSASEHPNGAPRFPGERYWIDAAKVEAAGGTIHEGSSIAKDLARISAKSKDVRFREYIEYIKKLSLEADREAVIEPGVPAGAIKGVAAMRMTRGLQVLQGFAILLTIWNLEAAARNSIKSGSGGPITRESIRQGSGWAGAAVGGIVARTGIKLASRWAVAMADAEIGGETGAALGIETGPGAILTGAVGCLIGGIIGFVAGDVAANLLIPGGSAKDDVK